MWHAKARLILTDLRKAHGHQPLDRFRHPHEEFGVAEFMNRIHRKAEHEALGVGYAEMHPGRSWTMKREMTSLRATTHWHDLVDVQA